MSPETPKPPTTLGLTGLTVNAMALIAPGAFLWLTFFIQASYGAPLAAAGMWFGILAALVLCLATAIAYAELSKLYVHSSSGKLVPLDTVANLVPSVGPLTVNHFGQLPGVTVSFNLKPGVALGDATRFVEEQVRKIMPADVTGSDGI